MAIFDQAMALLAAQLAAAGCDREPVAESTLSTLQKLLQAVGGAREELDVQRDAAMAALASRLDLQIVAVTDRLIRLHGLDGTATQTVLERMRTNFATPDKVGEGRAALWGSVVTGALTGLKADIAAGGLTLGAGLLLGGLIGGLAGAGVARGLNCLSGADQPVVGWSVAFLEGLVRSAVLRYLAVAHFGRGRGKWVDGEASAWWKDEVASVVERQQPRLRAAWALVARDGAAAEPALAQALRVVLGLASADVLERLYPGRVPAQLREAGGPRDRSADT